jgi:hypothetical protein
VKWTMLVVLICCAMIITGVALGAHVFLWEVILWQMTTAAWAWLALRKRP